MTTSVWSRRVVTRLILQQNVPWMFQCSHNSENWMLLERLANNQFVPENLGQRFRCQCNHQNSTNNFREYFYLGLKCDLCTLSGVQIWPLKMKEIHPKIHITLLNCNFLIWVISIVWWLAGDSKYKMQFYRNWSVVSPVIWKRNLCQDMLRGLCRLSCHREVIKKIAITCRYQLVDKQEILTVMSQIYLHIDDKFIATTEMLIFKCILQ